MNSNILEIYWSFLHNICYMAIIGYTLQTSRLLIQVYSFAFQEFHITALECFTIQYNSTLASVKCLAVAAVCFIAAVKFSIAEDQL